jgi:2-polyprenyl-3-methyl-5-hydroxy-6-metoxy-1,4-benzoquinol methylase
LNSTSAFDAQADAYDAQFSHTLIGGLMRRAVWARCAARFTAGSSILEMNCGTGDDALWMTQRGLKVLATDVAPNMLRIARLKLAEIPAAQVQIRQLAWEQLGTLDAGPFDGMLSNFGGLNCVEDLGTVARALAARLRPGATAILCIMGPRVPWEWLWFLSQGLPAAAFRRMRSQGTTWAGMRIRYPSIRQASRAFAPEFRVSRVSAIGAILPPPYTGRVLARLPRLVGALNCLERRIDTLWPLPELADHYLLELQRA